MSGRLSRLVQNKIEELGVSGASKHFGVSIGTVSNWLNGKTSPSVEAVEIVLAESQPVIANVDENPHLTMWEGKDVILLQPTYRTINPKTHFTLFANYAKYGPDKIGIIPQEGTVIHESRNILVHKWLQTNARFGIMVDDDMVLPCGNDMIFNGNFEAGIKTECAKLNAISRIMSHGADKAIVGALYYGRHRYGKAQCSMGFRNEDYNDKFRAEQYSGLVADDWVGTGFIRIERSSILKLKEAIDGGMFPECLPSREGEWYGYFNPLKVGIGEDVSFCTRMKKIGIQTYVDASLVCLHADGNTLYGPKNTKRKTR